MNLIRKIRRKAQISLEPHEFALSRKKLPYSEFVCVLGFHIDVFSSKKIEKKSWKHYNVKYPHNGIYVDEFRGLCGIQQ